jgi:DNA-binding CsgD family transcriptional regulator
MAEQLGISERTVKNHLWRIYKKVGVEKRSQLFSMLAIL